MSEIYTDMIEWDKELAEIYETDLDGHGTREGLVYGYVVEGSYRNRVQHTYTAIATSEPPYDSVEVQENTIEHYDTDPIFEEE